MTYLSLGFKIFSQKLTLNIIVIIQLTLSLFLFNLVIGDIQGMYRVNNLANELSEEKGVYFFPSMINMIIDAGKGENSSITTPESITQEALSKVQDIRVVCDIDQYSLLDTGNNINSNYKFAEMYSYNEFFSSKLKLPLSSGKWYTDVPYDSDIINVVITQNYHNLKPNSIISLTLEEGNNQVEVKLRITGILKDPAFILENNSGGTDMTWRELFSWYNPKYQEAPVLLCSQEQLMKYEHLSYTTQIGNFIFFDNDISSETFNNNVSKLSEYGDALPIKEISKYSNEIAKDSLYIYLPSAIFVFFIGIIGLISLTILNNIQYKRFFAIHFICGCRWKDCFKINFAYVFYIVFSSLLMLICAINIAKFFDDTLSQSFIITKFNIIITLLIILFVSFISLLTPYIIHKNSSPKSILTEKGD